MPPPGWIVIGIAALAIVVGVAIDAAVRAERRRRDELARAAAAMGLEFRGDEAPPALAASAAPLFHAGRGNRFRNVMRGTIEDLDITIFDFEYTTGSGKSTSTWRQTVAAFRPGRAIIAFQVRPEHLFHKIGQAFGYRDIDLPEHPAFSKRFLLRGPSGGTPPSGEGSDEQAIRRLFRPEVVACFEATKGLCVESDGQWLVVYRSSHRVKPPEIGAFFEEAFGIANVIVA
jgi:hypothetical protein